MLAEHEDWEILVLDKLTYAGNMENLEPVASDSRYAFSKVDIADPHAVREALSAFGTADALVNFAAETHVDRSIADARAFLTTDVFGVHVLLEAVRDHGIGRMVQVSTDEVYGPIRTGSAAEDAPLNPTSPYSASKAGADLQALAHRVTYGTDVVITRGSNTYGPYQYPEKLVPLFATNLLEGQRLPLYGEGLNVRDWLHVDDHVRGVEAALLHGSAGQVYNLGGGHELTNKQITAAILAALGRTWDECVERVADRPGHDLRYSIDSTKAARELGWVPAAVFDDEIKNTVEWYQEHIEWWARLKHSDDFEEWVDRWYASRQGIDDESPTHIAQESRG
jgi:dTDP-glucose 4,6-dehydratase